MNLHYTLTQYFTPPCYVKTLIFTLLLFSAMPVANAQSCSNAPQVQPQTFFDWFEDNGEAFVAINATDPVISLKAFWSEGMPLPTSFTLLHGTCNNNTVITTELVYNPEDYTFHYRFDSLIPGDDYLLKFEGTAGSNFTIDGYFTFSIINPPGTCATTGGCNLIENPGFDDLDANVPSNMASRSLTGPSAVIDEACGWDDAYAANSSPDYYLAQLDPSYLSSTLTCNTTSNENVCATRGQNGSDGAVRLFTIDNRQNVANPTRREYIYSRLTSNLEQGRNYFLRVNVQHETIRNTRCTSLQTAFANNFNQISTASTVLGTNFGEQQIDFADDIDLTNINWQTHATIFKYNSATPSNTIILGNFLDNATTNNPANNYYSVVGPTPTQPHFVPALYLDNLELIEVPNAGDDIVSCYTGQFTLGMPNNYCLANSNYTLEWTDSQGNILGNTTTLTTTISTAGTYTYYLEITYQGQVLIDEVKVFIAPKPTITPINSVSCPPTNQVEYNFNYMPANTSSITLSSTDVTWTNNNPIGSNGIITLINPVISPAAGIGTVTVTGTFPFNGETCNVYETFNVFSCCDNNTGGTPVLNQPFSIANQGTSGEMYNIYGTVNLDDNFFFDNCHFFLQPDAQLVVDPNFQITFDNCTFESCNNYKWDRIFNNHASSNLEMINCTITEALRGVHSENDAFVDINNCQFYDNTISQYIYNYANASGLITCESNSYNMYPINSLTQQHAQSSVNLAPLLNLLDAKVVGIKVEDAFEVTINNGNTFWSDYTTNWNEYLHLWYENSSGIIDNNTFYEGRNIYLKNSDVSVVNVNEFESTQQPYGQPTGVEALNSIASINNNRFKDGARIVSTEPTSTIATYNVITDNYGLPSIEVKKTVLGVAFTKIQHNNITGAFGIKTENINTIWQQSGTPTKKLLINFNEIHLTHPYNQGNITTNVTGIFADHCPGVSIGENQIYCTDVQNGAVLNDITSEKVIGIKLNESPNGFVGCNIPINYCGRGLELKGDASRETWQSSNQYQSNEFGSNYNGIYLNNGAIVDNFGSSGLGADNKWVDIPGIWYNVGVRVLDAGIITNPSYHHQGLKNISNQYWAQTNSFLLSIFGNAMSNSCNTPPPSFKTKKVIRSLELITFPNPTEDILNIEILYSSVTTLQSTANLVNLTGQIVASSEFNNLESSIDVSNLTKGLYILTVNHNGNVLSEKVIIQ